MSSPARGFRRVISIAGLDPISLLGPADCNLVALGRRFRSRIVARGDELILTGPAEEESELSATVERLLGRCRRGETLTPELVDAECGRQPVEAANGADPLTLRTPRKVIVAKTPNQREYLAAIRSADIVFSIGPAGTGKTYLAVAAAVEALTTGRASRIVLTRPAVEAGESLGYLPGTFKDKVDPYLRPLYDALFDMVPLERARRLIEEEVVEVAPLAFMRGRTLSDSFIILDEAQNTTSTQMRMFLTRLGWNSKAVVTGDVTQIDLAARHASGLIEAEERLAGVPGIIIVRLGAQDVVRPPLVSRIIAAYDRESNGRAGDPPLV